MPKSGTLDPCEVPTQRNERIWSTDKKKRKEKSIRQNKMKQYFKASSKTQSSASVNRVGTAAQRHLPIVCLKIRQ